MHYIPIIDAGISGDNDSYLPYDEGIKQDIFVKDGESDKPFIGKVWNRFSTVWPDFTNPKTMIYYANMMGDMHNNFAYDGAWIVSMLKITVKNYFNIIELFLNYFKFFNHQGYERTIQFLQW